MRKQTHSSSKSSSKESPKEKAQNRSSGDQSDSSDDEDTKFEDEPSLKDVIQEIVKDKGVIGEHATDAV